MRWPLCRQESNPLMSTDSFTSPEPVNAPSPTSPGGAPPLDIKRMFRLWMPLMRNVFIVLVIPLVAAAWFVVPAKYTATAEIRFLSSAPVVMQFPEAYRETASSYDKFLNTQISLITGNTILSRVLNDPGIQALPSIAKAPDPLEMLKSCVNVRIQRNSELVSITCSLPEQESPKKILDKVIAEYMDYALNEEATQGSDRLNVLTKERDSRQMELEMQLQQIVDLQKKMGVPIVGMNTLETQEGDQYRENMLRAEEEVARGESEAAGIDSQLEKIKDLREANKKAPETPLFEYGIEDRVAADPQVNALRADVARSEAELAHISTRMLEASPQRKAEEKRLASYKSSLGKVEQTARGGALDSVQAQYEEKRNSLAKTIQESKARKDKLEEALNAYNQRVENATSRLSELEELKQKANETRTLLEDVRRAITQVAMESKAPARVQLASQPFMPAGGPDYKQRLLVMALMAAVAAFLGLTAGLMRELLDQHVRSPQDVLRITRLPVIGTIPHVREDRQLPKKVSMPLVMAEHPQSTTADEYRRVLVRFLYPDESRVEMKTTVIASASKGDGKTSLSCNIALALSQANRRVLLVDVSERRPSLEKCFHLDRGPGLAEILHEERDPEELVRHTGFKNVYVLGPGSDREELGSKLASREMSRFLEWAEKNFDHVILDTPPTLIMSDAKFVAPIADGVVLVVGVGVSTRGMVRRCILEMRQAGANIQGLVLNGLKRTRGGYMNKNVEAYYGYGQEHGSGAREKPYKYTRAESTVVVVPKNARGQYREEEEEPVVLMPYTGEDEEAERPQEAHPEIVLPEEERESGR